MAFDDGGLLDHLDEIQSIAAQGTFDRTTDSLEALAAAIGGGGGGSAVSVTSATSAGNIVGVNDGSVSPTASVRDSTTADTFGAWVEYEDSLAQDSWLFAIFHAVPGAAILQCTLQIGIGAAGSETSIIQLNPRGNGGAYGSSKLPKEIMLPIPIKIDSGTRIAIRAAGSRALSDVHYVDLNWYKGLET